jgi:soluble lytic murein transglycosylase-like protein
MNMSTVSGFLLGALTAASLTVLYGDKFHYSLSEAAARYSVDSPVAADFAQASTTLSAVALSTKVPQIELEAQLIVQPAAAEEAGDSQPELEQRWAEFAAQADTLLPAGEFPWRSCFARAAATYELPETLLLAIASGESNFDPAARSDKDAVGLMQIRWPDTSRHLGVLREADLYDPCTNVDAGARYLLELARKFDNNLHLMLAAYNYGPGRIAPGSIPEGARWYSEYIYQHLQQVLGAEFVATSRVIPSATGANAGHQLVMSFNAPERARDFISFLNGQIPELSLQLQNEALGQHDVVLLYRSESERQSALNLISAAGVVPLSGTQTL